jgi:hypothetical protein
MKLAKELTKRKIEEHIKEHERDWNTPEGARDKETFEKIHEVLLNNGCLDCKP